MLVSESYVNKTEGYRLGDSGFYEPYTDNIKRLFKAYQKEFGKCVSKVYTDSENDTTIAIGWVFEKRMKYDDCNEYYIQETWITLHDKQPTVNTTHHYHALS